MPDDVLVEFLLDTGLLSRSQLVQATEEARRLKQGLSQALVESGIVSDTELQRARAHVLGVPFVAIAESDLNPEVFSLIPEPLSRAQTLIALRQEGEVLEVAMKDLESVAFLNALRLPYTIRPHLSDTASLTRALIRYQQHLQTRFTPDLDGILLRALAQHASEIHLEPHGDALLVRYRIGGLLREAFVLPGRSIPEITSRIAVLAKLLPGARVPQEGRFIVEREPDHAQVTVRVTTRPLSVGEKIALHLAIGHDSSGVSLGGIGLWGEPLEVIHRALACPSGLILVYGREVAEITRLLYALTGFLVDPTRSLAVIEGGEVSAAAALRAALRQGTDVIMVPEIRDTEVAALVLSAANRGVLVLAGIQAAKALTAFNLLLAFETSRALLATSLICAVGVERTRRLCSVSAQSYRPSRSELAFLEPHADFSLVLSALKEAKVISPDSAWKDVQFFRPEPCAHCQGGYVGYVGLQAVVENSLLLKTFLLEGNLDTDMDAVLRENGGLRLVEDGLCKAVQGITALEEVIRVAEAEAA